MPIEPSYAPTSTNSITMMGLGFVAGLVALIILFIVFYSRLNPKKRLYIGLLLAIVACFIAGVATDELLFYKHGYFYKSQGLVNTNVVAPNNVCVNC